MKASVTVSFQGIESRGHLTDILFNSTLWLLDWLHVQSTPSQPPIADTKEGHSPHPERTAIHRSSFPFPLRPHGVACPACAEEFRMKVRNTLEHSRPVLPYLSTSCEGAIRMNRLLAMIILREAIEESFQIL